MSNHVTTDELARFRTSGLSPDDVQRVARHLGECRLCASAARETQDVGDVADGFRNALAEEELADARIAFSRRRRAVGYAIAAIAVIGLVIALLQQPVKRTIVLPSQPRKITTI